MLRRMTKHEEETLTRYRMLRTPLGLTQNRASVRLKIDPTRFWKIEHGQVDPTDEEVDRMCKLYGVDAVAVRGVPTAADVTGADR